MKSLVHHQQRKVGRSQNGPPVMIQSGNCIKPARNSRSGVCEMTILFWILLRLLNDPVKNTFLTSCLQMDPRRTRDPRLARAQAADPRRSASNTPQPTPYGVYNGAPQPGSSSYTPNTSTPPQPFVQAGETVVQQFPQMAAAGPSQLLATSEAGTPSSYKARPLFCVVCASNQVKSFYSFAQLTS